MRGFLTWPRWQRALVIVLLIGVAVHFGVTLHKRHEDLGDYGVLREFGRRFLVGEDLYAGGLAYNYMPIMAMYSAAMAMVPPLVGFVGRYLLALTSLAAVLWIMYALVRRDGSQLRDPRGVMLLTIVLGLHYLVRDLDDGGPHLILLAMLVGGYSLAAHGRHFCAGLLWGLPIAVKLSPGLLLPLLAWKRQWRLLGITSAATLAWMLAPAIWMGPTTWWQSQQQWTQTTLAVFRGDGSAGTAANEQRVQNQALEPAIRRYLETYPAGHHLKLEHPADVAFLDLSRDMAQRTAQLLMLALVGGLMWWSRRSVPVDSPRALREFSMLLIMMLLLAPIAWLQHLVFLVPAIYLLMVCRDRCGSWPTGARMAVTLYVLLSLVLNRELLGKSNYMVLLSYHSHTLCMLLVLGLLWFWKAAEPQGAEAGLRDHAEPPLPVSARRAA